jgi:hypothetical protein
MTRLQIVSPRGTWGRKFMSDLTTAFAVLLVESE